MTARSLGNYDRVKGWGHFLVIKKTGLLLWLGISTAFSAESVENLYWLNEVRPCVTGLFHRPPYLEADWKPISGKHYFLSIEKDSPQSSVSPPLVIRSLGDATLAVFIGNKVYSSSPLPPLILAFENRLYPNGFPTSSDYDLPAQQRDGAWTIYLSIPGLTMNAAAGPWLKVSYQISSDRTSENAPTGVSTRIHIDSEGITSEPPSSYEKNISLALKEVSDPALIERYKLETLKILRAQFNFFEPNYSRRSLRHQNTRNYEVCPNPKLFISAIDQCLYFAACQGHSSFAESLRNQLVFFKQAQTDHPCPEGVAYQSKLSSTLIDARGTPPKNVKPWGPHIRAVSTDAPASNSLAKKKKKPAPATGNSSGAERPASSTSSSTAPKP